MKAQAVLGMLNAMRCAAMQFGWCKTIGIVGAAAAARVEIPVLLRINSCLV